MDITPEALQTPELDYANLVAHPLAEMFPMMEGEAFDGLVENIKQNGCHYPIILHEGKILDGRNRYRALRQLGSDNIPTLPYDGIDPLGFVISSNLHRRHLTAEQKREVIARVLKAQPKRSDRAIGRLAQADNKTVAAVRSNLEAREEIPHVATRADTKGRQQPASKPAPPKLRSQRARDQLEQRRAIFKEHRQPPLCPACAPELTKLWPFIEKLKVEGKKNAATAAPLAVFILANQLEQLVRGWTDDPE